MYLQIIILPLFSFLIVILFGRFLSHLGVAIISLALIGLATVISFFIFYETALLVNPCFLVLGKWIEVLNFKVYWNFYFDFLSSSMLLVVFIVSFLVHMYSVDYMWGDPHFPRFMSYLSLFTFFMILLVSSGNILQLFIGWEGVGLSSYLLISFWFTRLQASLSSLKAFIINRVGDSFFLLGLTIIYILFGSFDYSIIFLSLNSQKNNLFQLLMPYTTSWYFSEINFFYFWKISALEAAGFCFFIGAMSKSAQIFLHTWLPDAMEGPTPVSALIHAATMVAAGVFFILRFSYIFDMIPSVLFIISTIGAITCFFSATIGVFQNDIKKVIAYSTCSQLGYMFFVAGLSFYSVSFFHLTSHAFFKALLFLSAGSVIHAVSDFQDIRKMGGLIMKMPLTYTSFLVGSLALAGLPFLSGFYSKEAILEKSLTISFFSKDFTRFMGLFAAIFTSFYSFKLLYLGFIQKPKINEKIFEKSSESFSFISLTLFILGVFSIFFGFFSQDFFIGYGLPLWSLSGSSLNSNSEYFDSEILPFFLKVLPLLLSLLGIYFSNLVFLHRFKALKMPKFFSNFFYKKWYFDVVYNYFIVKFFLFFSYNIIYKLLDKGVFEFVGPLTLSVLVKNLKKNFLDFQTGFIYHYIYYMVSIIFFSLFYIYGLMYLGISFKKSVFFILFLYIYSIAPKKFKQFKYGHAPFGGVYFFAVFCYLAYFFFKYL